LKVIKELNYYDWLRELKLIKKKAIMSKSVKADLMEKLSSEVKRSLIRSRWHLYQMKINYHHHRQAKVELLLHLTVLLEESQQRVILGHHHPLLI
jgi:hypothetical protein